MEKVKKLLQNAKSISLEQISAIVAADKNLCRRAYAIAFPGRTDVPETQMDAAAAVSRVGINILVILALGNILNSTVIRTFETMTQMGLKSGNPLNCLKSEDEYITGCVSFHGKANGMIYMVFEDGLAEKVYGSIYGKSQIDESQRYLVHDTIGELVNIIAGNLQSNLCDAGLDCKIVVPSVSRMEMSHMNRPPGYHHEVFVFIYEGSPCWVHLLVNPECC